MVISLVDMVDFYKTLVEIVLYPNNYSDIYIVLWRMSAGCDSQSSPTLVITHRCAIKHLDLDFIILFIQIISIFLSALLFTTLALASGDVWVVGHSVTRTSMEFSKLKCRHLTIQCSCKLPFEHHHCHRSYRLFICWRWSCSFRVFF